MCPPFDVLRQLNLLEKVSPDFLDQNSMLPLRTKSVNIKCLSWHVLYLHLYKPCSNILAVSGTPTPPCWETLAMFGDNFDCQKSG